MAQEYAGARVAAGAPSEQAGEPAAGGALAQPPAPVAFHYTQSESFVALLHQLGATLLVSTYQANKLLAVRASGQGLSTLVRTFDKPMGLAVNGSRLALGARKEIWFLRNAPDIAPQVEPSGMYEACAERRCQADRIFRDGPFECRCQHGSRFVSPHAGIATWPRFF
jgi:uncharacterized protein DUF4915